MPEVTHDQKVSFLKHLFPDKMYSFKQIAKTLDCSVHTVEYWVMIWEVPTLKIVGTPRIIQANLVNMFLRADKKNHNEDRLVGLEFVIEDAGGVK